MARIAPIHASPVTAQPSSRPCHTATMRHQGSTLFSAGSESPIAAPSAPGISLRRARAAARTVADHGLGSPGPICSPMAVSALSISACWAPAGPADTPRNSSHRLPSRSLRTGSRPSTRSTSHDTGQPT